MTADAARAGDGRRWQFVLPYPPSVNHIYRHTRAGRVYRVPQVTRYERAAWTAMRLQLRPFPRPSGPVRLLIELYPPDARRRDADNTVKVVQDSVFRTLGRDDVTVAEVSAYRREIDRANPRAEVVLEEIDR
jgi:Holliday junction resolvase RusA-like endonuclease